MDGGNHHRWAWWAVRKPVILLAPDNYDKDLKKSALFFVLYKKLADTGYLVTVASNGPFFPIMNDRWALWSAVARWLTGKNEVSGKTLVSPILFTINPTRTTLRLHPALHGEALANNLLCLAWLRSFKVQYFEFVSWWHNMNINALRQHSIVAHFRTCCCCQKSNKYYIFSVCVCSLTYPACKVQVCALSGCTHFF